MAQILCSISFQSLFFAGWLTNTTQEGFIKAWTQKTCWPHVPPLQRVGSRWQSQQIRWMCAEVVSRELFLCVCFRKGGVGRGWLTDGQSEAFISWSVWRKHRPHLDPPVQLALVPAHNPSLWIRCQKPFPVINYFLCNLSGLRLSKSQPVHIAVCA